ncbi:MAG: Gfo/Idh/MocA family oxidoreductase [Gemmatimonadetes bacterium]|nr:Gfo/Idh/MocA family oxidoreductase [Gemmatimonadota bacterium]
MASVPGVCLIGCGKWGAVHALGMRALGPRIRRFFASRTPSRAAEFARRFAGDDVFVDASSAIGDARVDAVILATPHDTHAPLARAALEAGKHVLIEKPIALTIEDAGQLVELAERHGLCLGVAEQYRSSPLIQALRRMLDEGRTGPVLFANGSAITKFDPAEAWKRDLRSAGGGVILDVGIHYIDMFRFLLGEARHVLALAPSRQGAEPERSANVVLGFDRGVSAHLAISWRGQRAGGTPNLELVGERAVLQIDFRKPRIVEWTALPDGHWSNRARAALPWRIRSRVPGLMARLPGAQRRRLAVPADDLIGSHAAIDDFVRAFTEGRPPAVDGREGTRDLAVVLAAYESIESGRLTPITDPFGAAAAPGMDDSGVREAGRA